MTLVAGTRLGPYEVLSPLGAGGMGEVYRARDPKLNREVAIKVLPDALAADPAALARFEREAQAVAALSHPNILAIHDFGVERGTPYAVMELLEGQTLREVAGGGAVPPRKAVAYALQMAAGLGAAHARGITHRDLKPENVFVTRDGQVKILDFGLAKQRPAASASASVALTGQAATGAGTVLGTVGYMAPEQVRGQEVDARADIFALGAVLYELLAGRRAFQGATPADTISAILKEDPPELTASTAALVPRWTASSGGAWRSTRTSASSRRATWPSPSRRCRDRAPAPALARLPLRRPDGDGCAQRRRRSAPSSRSPPASSSAAA
jgi:serine/threonine protein kinase